jgi:hypothetical protein
VVLQSTPIILAKAKVERWRAVWVPHWVRHHVAVHRRELWAWQGAVELRRRVIGHHERMGAMGSHMRPLNVVAAGLRPAAVEAGFSPSHALRLLVLDQSILEMIKFRVSVEAFAEP